MENPKARPRPGNKDRNSKARKPGGGGALLKGSADFVQWAIGTLVEVIGCFVQG